MKSNISSKQAVLFTGINYVGVLIGVLSTILVYPLDKELLGIIRFVDACAQIMFPIIVLGSTHALINYYPRLSDQLQRSLFSFSLFSLLRLAIGLGILVLVLYWSFGIGHSKFNYLLYGYPLAVAMAYIELFRRQAANLQRLSVPTFFEKIIPKLTLPMVFLLVIYWQTSIANALSIYIIAYWFIVVLIGSYIYRYFRFTWQWKFTSLFEELSIKDYYRYSLYAFAGSFGSFFAFRVDSLMIPSFLSFEANGTYTIGVTLASTLAIPATGVFALYAPVIAKLITNIQLRELNMKYKEVARILFFVGMFLFSCVFVGVESLFRLMPTYDKLAPSLPIIYVLGANVVINMATGFNNEIISYSKYYRFNLVSILSLMVINVGLNLYFLTQTTSGILGVGIASLLSLTLYNIAKTFYIYKKMRLWPFDQVYLKLVLSMVTILLCVFYLPNVYSDFVTLIIKVGLVIISNGFVFFSTNWVFGLKVEVLKYLKIFRSREKL
ncbi:lipopolysaccharide biosynthesis protein [Myroides pelagicus]|uniref:Oligosaccharide flippase family protein n=1 Tax=Myroides pelagicus TaxID=270914 RepID=A0A7K1GK36_9FLAO|nr:oligosaccharide flippase family protein [Myroides pelagicus]MTH28783.1 oligosaccharide flippase family protein [Myroides pelagicus]